jgi:DNA-binding transcriptional LysR family regulator
MTSIQGMKNIDNDLQLSDLRAVLTLLDAGTVTRAAERMGMSQSALSYKIERLRQQFGDPLFVRVGNRMAPTPLVVRLAEPAMQVLRIFETDIQGPAHFDPATSERVFCIGVNEIGAIVLLPRLVQRLAEVAPHARITQVQVEPAGLAAALESGAMDLVAGYVAQADHNLKQRLLYQRDYVCIAARDHPRVGRRIGFEAFFSEGQIQSPGIPLTNAWVQRQLNETGLKPPPIMLTQNVAAMPFIVAASNLLALVPREVYELFSPIAAIKTVALPTVIPPVVVHEYWHPRMTGDPANRFFRDFVYTVARE